MDKRLTIGGQQINDGYINTAGHFENGGADEIKGNILDLVEELRMKVALLLPIDLINFSRKNHPRGKTDKFDKEDMRDIVARLRDIILRQIDYYNFECPKKYRDFVHVSCEKGLNASQAIRCLDDYIRTSKFIEALFYHLEDIEKRDDGQIEMVDAGCGPIPLYGLLAAIKSKRVKVTCIEVNPHSVLIARDIVKKFGLADRVSVLERDAETYQHDKDIDLFVTETMYSGLLGGEPMAQIYNNFSSQVKDSGVMIPEAVSVDVGLVDMSTYLMAGCMVRQTGGVGVDVKLPTACVLDRTHPVKIIEQTIPLKDLPPKRYMILASSTLQLHTERNVILNPFESVITTPVDVSTSAITINDHERRECESIVIRYCAGSHAGDTTTVSYVPKGGRTYVRS